MPDGPIKFAGRLKKVADAWSQAAPGKSYGGMTLADFKSRTKPSLDARDEITHLKIQMLAALDHRMDADKAGAKLVQLVINGVKGDPDEGDNGKLYALMGYIRKSERKSGKTNKRKPSPVPPA